MSKPTVPDIFLAKFHRAAIKCNVLFLSGGPQALRFFRDLDGDLKLRAPDLLLLVSHLRNHDGQQIVKRVGASRRCAETPVVVTSSSDSPMARAGAGRHSARYFESPSD